MPHRIEDYALIGDMQTGALVGPDGTADWLCMPDFDSPAVFAGLLGTEQHGFWRISPAHAENTLPPVASSRRYRGQSLVLETEWHVPGHGTVRVTDFMPTGEDTPRLVRIVEGVTGRVRMRSALHATVYYGRHTAAQRTIDGRTVFLVSTGALWLDTSADVAIGAGGEFTVGEGESVTFALSWQPGTAVAPEPPDAYDALLRTEAYWQKWAAQSTYQGPYTEAVTRSALTLKALTHLPTGAPVAALTTSLPEDIGGIRNWDYRYTWLRDAAITMAALLSLGYLDEARAWRAWLLRVIAQDLDNLQIMYGIRGERDLSETELDWLPGYEKVVETTVSFLKGRARYGGSLSDQPVVRDRIGEMESRLRDARILAYQAVYLRDLGLSCDAELINSKYRGHALAVQSAQDAMELHGAHAFRADCPLQRLWRDVQYTYPPAGTGEVQRIQLAHAALGEDPIQWSERLPAEPAWTAASLTPA